MGVKVSPGRVKVEQRDAARVASRSGLPLREVLYRAETVWRRRDEETPATRRAAELPPKALRRRSARATVARDDTATSASPTAPVPWEWWTDRRAIPAGPPRTPSPGPTSSGSPGSRPPTTLTRRTGPDSSGPRHWRRRRPASMLGAAMLGLHEVIYGPHERRSPSSSMRGRAPRRRRTRGTSRPRSSGTVRGHRPPRGRGRRHPSLRPEPTKARPQCQYRRRPDSPDVRRSDRSRRVGRRGCDRTLRRTARCDPRRSGDGDEPGEVRGEPYSVRVRHHAVLAALPDGDGTRDGGEVESPLGRNAMSSSCHPSVPVIPPPPGTGP